MSGDCYRIGLNSFVQGDCMGWIYLRGSESGIIAGCFECPLEDLMLIMYIIIIYTFIVYLPYWPILLCYSFPSIFFELLWLIFRRGIIWSAEFTDKFVDVVIRSRQMPGECLVWSLLFLSTLFSIYFSKSASISMLLATITERISQ